MRGMIRSKQHRLAGRLGIALAATLLGSSAVHAQTATTDSNVVPFYGNIDPFYGNIDPFYGNIDPFWGNIDPFWGNIDPFYGNIEPFWGNIDPFTATTLTTAPAWGNIGTFWTNVGNYWKETNTLWGDAGTYSSNPSGYQTVADRLKEISRLSETTWGAAVTSVTGQSFTAGFANPLFAKYGIDPNSPSSLAALSASQRSKFFLDWYDGLMNYSGRDRIDHWMHTVNWSPAITQQQGWGADTTIGLIDASLAGEADMIDNLKYSGGYTTLVSGHGAGVASLIAAAHDGKGVMGIAPNVQIAMYNPYSSTSGATWSDIRTGITALKGQGASIINMSLGEAGYAFSPDWNNVFANDAITPYKANTLYVVAAGNDGVSQTANIDWTQSVGTVFLVVGSVDLNGNISQFSNRPGTACLTYDGTCFSNMGLTDPGRLMKNFLVAPGELMLVADGQGGVVRRSGTSFAAPLVSGAIALLHDRWPWLASKPKETAEIILRSAKDLGDPGVDSTYGWGMLDVGASQAPLSFSGLTFYLWKNGAMTQYSAKQLKTGGVKNTWEADGVYFTFFETIGSTTRDFVVPFSSKLSGNVMTSMAGSQAFQRFITQRMTDWINGLSGYTDVRSFSDVRNYTTQMTGGWKLSYSSGTPLQYSPDGRSMAPHTALRLSDPTGRFGLTTGYGEGGMALNTQSGFGLTSDYAGSGGVNPMLGLASGGAFFGADYKIAPRTRVSFGFSEKSLAPEDNLSLGESERTPLSGLDPYKAEAMNIGVTHELNDSVTLSANYTRLREKNALLAVQSSGGELDGGSTSDSATLGASFALPHGLTIAASASAGRTRAGNSDQALYTGKGAVTTAFAAAATKVGVVGKRDMLRLSVAQPIHIESGTLNYQSVEVVDRQTGEIGVVTRPFDISSKQRHYTSEVLYAAPIMAGEGELSLFGRADFGSADHSANGVVAGARVRLKF